MTEPDTMLMIERLIIDGQQRRSARADRAWNTLTPFERRILKEAAVMGYVLGRQDGLIMRERGQSILNATENYPRDFAIVQDVIEHCDSTADNFPYLANACDGRRLRITKTRLWPGETR